MMRHILSLLLENEPGALSRVAGLISARGYNIESLSVAPTDDPSLSRMTLVTSGDDSIVEQITKQLNKLVDVVKLMDVTEGAHIERELLLVKVKAATAAARDEIARLTSAFRGQVVDINRNSYVVEVTGTGDKLAAFIAALLFVGGAVVAAPAADAAPKTFKNCTAVNKVHAGGIARKGVKGNTAKGKVVPFKTRPVFDTALYEANKKMDRDKDGIACER